MSNVFEAVKPHFNALAMVGYYTIVSEPVQRNKLILHNFYRVIIWGLVLMYNLQHIIRAFQASMGWVPTRGCLVIVWIMLQKTATVFSLQCPQQLVDTLFILLTTLNTLGKQTAFNIREHRVNNVITMWNDCTSFTTSATEHHAMVIEANAILMSRILNLYLFACTFCGILWTIFPIVNKALYGDVHLSAYFPYDTSTSPTYEITVLFMSAIITLQAYGNVTMDCTIVTFYSQAQTQLKILRHNLEHLTDINKNKESKADCFSCEDSFKRVIRARFKKCVQHYERIVWFVKEVESIFSEAMFIQFLVMAWVICMTLYKIVGLDTFSMEYVSMVTYLMCMAAQLFIYCYYGTQLKYESELIIDATYNMEWLRLTPDVRRELIIFMEYCKLPVEPRTAYIIPHSLVTYTTVLRSSYALFTFLTKK